MDHIIGKDSSKDKLRLIEDKWRRYFKERLHWWHTLFHLNSKIFKYIKYIKSMKSMKSHLNQSNSYGIAYIILM